MNRSAPVLISTLRPAGLRRRTYLSLATLLIAVTVIAFGQAGDRKTSGPAETIAAMHKSWGPKANSPGTDLRIEEASRSQVDGHQVVKYRLIASGITSEKVYSLVVWPLNGQPTKALAGITIDSQGMAICPGRPGTCGSADKPDDPIELKVSGGLAEPKRFGLVSSDQSIKVFAVVVPFPNRSTDHGCTLEEILLVPNSEAVILRGSGFAKGASLRIGADAEGENRDQMVKADDSGVYEMLLLPFKKGVAKGRTTVTFQSDSCSPMLSFDWGKGSYQPQ